MDDIKLSIIIPHYKTPESLLKLLDSIPEKEGVEVIIVDDNSQMDLHVITDYIESHDLPDISLYSNDSGVKGAGAARNVGLGKVRGKWVLFADADDFFVDGFYDNVKGYFESDYDMVYFPPTSMDIVTGEKSSRHVMYMELVENFAKKGTLKAQTEMKYGFCTPWSKLIRYSIIRDNNITFDEIMVSNDIMCMTKCAYFSKNVFSDSNTIYCVTRGGKTLTSKKDENRFDTRVNVLVDRYTFLREHLSKKEFNYAHIDRLALGKIVDVFIERWGIKKLISILRLYHDNKVRYFDVGLLNPFTLFHKAKIELSWWWDIKKHR